MKILVTGGAGFIGSHVAERFIRGGYEVHIIDNLSSGSSENVPDGATFHALDLRDPAMESMIAEEQFEAIVHHAAQLDVRRSVDDPVYDADINILGFLRLIEAGRKNGLKRLIFASTGGAIYGDTEEIPQSESHPLQPMSPYGITKLATEKYLYFYEKVYGVSTVILRYANVYGPRQGHYGEAGVIAIFIKQLLANTSPVIFGDGMQTRDYVYVEDVVEANFLALQAKHGGTYNIGTGIETSVKALFDYLREAVDASVTAENAPARPGEVHRSALSWARAERDFGWAPQVALPEGIEKTVDWFKSRTQGAV